MRSGMVNFHEDLTDLLIPIDKVLQHPDNPNDGDIEAIAKSIEFNGYVSPVIAQKSTGYIIAGNHRYQALLSLGAEVIPVVWVEMDDLSAKRYMLDDNHIASLAQNDPRQLLSILEELDEARLLETSSFGPLDLHQLQAILDMPPNYTDIASWPTISLTVPPHLKNAFYEFTNHAVSDHERLEMVLRMAGWKGEK